MQKHSTQISPFFVSSVSLGCAIALVVMDDVISKFTLIPPGVIEVICKLFAGLSLIAFVGYGLSTQLYDESRPSRPMAMLIYGILLYLLIGLSWTFQAATFLFVGLFLITSVLSLFTSR